MSVLCLVSHGRKDTRQQRTIYIVLQFILKLYNITINQTANSEFRFKSQNIHEIRFKYPSRALRHKLPEITSWKLCEQQQRVWKKSPVTPLVLYINNNIRFRGGAYLLSTRKIVGGWNENYFFNAINLTRVWSEEDSSHRAFVVVNFRFY